MKVRSYFLYLAVCLGISLISAGESRGLAFEENLGQTGTAVRYFARAGAETAYFGDRYVYLELSGKGERTSVVRMSFAGGRDDARWTAAGDLAQPVSYFVGTDRSRWIRGARQFGRLERRGVYPGIDVAYYGRDRRLEYDLLVERGADVGQVRLRFDGDVRAELRGDGAIELRTPAGVVVQRAPQIYQEDGAGKRTGVRGRFVRTHGGEFRLQVDAYDRGRRLVVDPVIEFASYLGGDGEDEIRAVGVNYVAGNTTSVAFPGAPAARRRTKNVFLRGTPAGTAYGQLAGTVVMGGTGGDELTCAAMTASGSQFYYVLGGATASRDFPLGIGVRVGVTDHYAGGATDGFVMIVTAGSYTEMSGYLIGGSGEDRVTAVAAMNGFYYGAGVTDSPDLPVTAGAFQTTLAGGKDGFVFSGFASVGASLFDLLSYFGGSGDDTINAIAPFSDATGTHLIFGGETRSTDLSQVFGGTMPLQGASDGFLAMLPFTTPMKAPSVVLIGGAGEDRVLALATRQGIQLPNSQVSAAQSVVVAGTTRSADFPLMSPLQSKLAGDSDAFVMRYSLPDLKLMFSTYLGGSGAESGTAVATDALEDIAVAGNTTSRDLPVMKAVQATPGGAGDGFYAFIDSSNQLRQLTYYGGSGEERVYGVSVGRGPGRIAGSTTSPDLPVRSAWQNAIDTGVDGFVADIATESVTGPDQVLVGKGLWNSQRYFVAAGTATLTVRSSDPSRVQLQDSKGAPTDSITIGGGLTSVGFLAMADSGHATVTITGAGYATKTIDVQLFPVAVTCAGSAVLSTWNTVGIATLSGYCHAGAWNAAANRFESYGSMDLSSVLSWTGGDPAVVKVQKNSFDWSAVPVGVGTTQLIASSADVNVLPGVLTVTVGVPSVLNQPIVLGKDMQSGLGTIFAPPAGAFIVGSPRGVVTFRSGDPSRLLLTTDRQTQGQESVKVSPGLGQTLYGQALAGDGVVRVSAESTELAPGGYFDVSLVPVTLSFGDSMTLVKGASSSSVLRASTPDGNFAGASFRPGVTVSAALESSDPNVVQADSVTFGVDAGIQVPLKAIGEGAAEVRVSSIKGTDATAGKPLQVKVTDGLAGLPKLPTFYVGKDLMSGTSVNLSRYMNAEVTIFVDDPRVAMVSLDGIQECKAQVKRIINSFSVGVNVCGLAESGQTMLHVVVPGGGTIDAPVILSPSAVGFITPQVTTDFYTEATLLLAAYILDDVTRIPLETQIPRPGVSIGLAMQQSGSSVKLDGNAVTLTSASPRAPVAITPTDVGDSDVWFDAPAGWAVAAKRGRATVSVTKAAIRLGGTPIGAYYGIIYVGVQTRTPATATSADPAKLLLTAGNGAPAASVTLRVGDQLGLVAMAASGATDIQISGANLTPLTVSVPLYPITVSASVFSPLLVGSTPVPPAINYTVAGGLYSNLSFRSDAPPLIVSASSSDPAVLSVSPTTADLSKNRNDILVAPVGVGAADVIFSVPSGYVLKTDRSRVTVRAPQFTLNRLVIGKDMQALMNIAPEPGGTPVDSKIVTVTSLSPDQVLLSRSATAAGQASITLAFQGGSPQSPPFWVQSLGDSGTVQLKLSAEGFSDATAEVQLVPSAFGLAGGPRQATVQDRLDSSVVFWYFSNNSWSQRYTLRAGAAPVTIHPSSSAPTILAVGDDVTFNAGDIQKAFTSNTLATGQATLSIDVPPGYADPGASQRSVPVTVNLKAFILNCGVSELGKDTQSGCVVSFSGSDPITVTSSRPDLLVVSKNGTSQGSGSVTITGFGQVYLQALASEGSVDVSFSGPNYSTVTKTIVLRPAAFVLSNALDYPQVTITMLVGQTLSPGLVLRAVRPDGTLSASNLSLRGGLAAMTVKLASTNPGAIAVPDSVTVAAGDSGAQFDVRAKTAGNAAVSLTQPDGFANPPAAFSKVNYLAK